MSFTHYLGICVLCAHYLQWSLIYSFLTDNANVIHMSSLVLFIYLIMYNLVSAHCLHRHTLSMSFACCPHMYTSFACHLYHSSYTLIIHNLVSVHIVSTHAHIVNIMCILPTDTLCMLCTSPFYCCYLHMSYMSSAYYLSISVYMHAHYLQWSLIYSFLTANANVIHMSSLVLFIYPIMYNLVSAHCLHRHTYCPVSVILSMSSVFAYVMYMSTHIFLPNRQYQCHPYTHVICLSCCPQCTYHLLVISNTHCIPYYPQLSFRAHCLHTCILSMSSVYCLEMHMLCTCHLYCCYLYMYMSSTYYLGIYVSCAHYLKWSLISSFLTDNTNVIHTSSLVVFIYSIMDNMLSAPFQDDMSSAPLPDDMSSTPLPDDMSSAPLPDDMSSALQRNMSYLFEVWEASNRSTRQLVWFIWLFDWLA